MELVEIGPDIASTDNVVLVTLARQMGHSHPWPGVTPGNSSVGSVTMQLTFTKNVTGYRMSGLE